MVWRTARRDSLAILRPLLAPAEIPSVNLRGHLPALDAVRGLAIVLVTLYRFGGGGHGPATALADPGLIALGSRGVDLFFVLSGFLITGILHDAKGKSHYFRNFYIRRSLRIFPLYYGVLVLAILILPWLSSAAATAMRPAATHQAWLWLYGSNVLQAATGSWPFGPLDHFWSLAVEEHFYLVWPLVIYCTSRTTALRICGGLAVASLAARVSWLAAGGNDVAAEVFTLLRLDSLAIGAWLALAARGENGLAWLVRRAWPTAILSGAALICQSFVGGRLLGLPPTIWAVFFGSLLVLTLVARPNTWRARFGNSAIFRFFGKYSYAMYVFQNLLIPLLAGLVTAPGLAAATGSVWLGQAIYCGLMFALTTLVALASWNLFEKHFLTLKSRFGG
ncbi:MAG: acyltransferase [Pirellulaceae bacterium]|nr:acyltransferase [Pirellulaceae bacterium]